MSQQGIKDAKNNSPWHIIESNKIESFVAHGDTVNIKLSKDALLGTLQLGENSTEVYLSEIKLEDISSKTNADNFTCTKSDLIKCKELKIVRTFVLVEILKDD